MFITTLASFLLAYYFVNIAGFPNAIKKALSYPPGKRMKPIDCVTCLSVWLCVGLLFLPQGVSNYLACAFGAGFIGYKIK